MNVSFALTRETAFKVDAQVPLRAATGTGTCPSTSEGIAAKFTASRIQQPDLFRMRAAEEAGRVVLNAPLRRSGQAPEGKVTLSS